MRLYCSNRQLQPLSPDPPVAHNFARAWGANLWIISLSFPTHSLRYAAAWQHCQPGKSIVLQDGSNTCLKGHIQNEKSVYHLLGVCCLNTWKCSAAPRWWMPNLSWCHLSGHGYADKSWRVAMALRISALWWYATVPLQEFLQAFRRVSLPTSWLTWWLTSQWMLAVCWFTPIGQGSQKEGHWWGGLPCDQTRDTTHLVQDA